MSITAAGGLRPAMPADDDVDRRLACAIDAARAAGERALFHYLNRDDLTVESKRDPQDVVSIADREVEQIIGEHVRAAFPDDGFLGEEFGLVAGASDYTWAVDPIDGTAPFLNGMPNWCVSIAVLKNDKPVVGVICAPCHDELYVSAKGRGAALNGRPLQIDPTRTVQNGMTGIGASLRVPPQQIGATICKLLEKGGSFIRNGSGALMLAYVASGRLVGYFEPHLNAWDCLAGMCLISEAGGWHSDFPTSGDGIITGAPVLAAAPGAKEDLLHIAQA